MAWRQSIVHAMNALSELGVHQITLVGLRLGATLAMLQGDDSRVNGIVAWAPVVSGKRFTKELRLLGIPVPLKSAVSYAGTIFSEETIEAINGINIEGIDLSETRVLTLDGSPQILNVQAEEAAVPHEMITNICEWIGIAGQQQDSEMYGVDTQMLYLHEKGPLASAQDGGVSVTTITSPRADTFIDMDGKRIHETVRRFRDTPTLGIFGNPPSEAQTIVVFLNSGSEPHIGPGRAWVEYARELNVKDYATLRLDWSGWGESPDNGHAPGRPYDPHCVEETVKVVQELRRIGYEKVVLVGLCVGAWMGLRAALETPVDAVIAINPQMYWQFGDPIEARLVDTRARRAEEIAYFKEMAAKGNVDS